MALSSTSRVLLIAVAAGVLGIVAGLVFNGPSPLLRSEIGQRALHRLIAANAPPTPAGLPVAERGQPIPALSLPQLDGGTIALPAAYPGRPILINFWASWCGPCIEEMPELERFAQAQGEDGTQVLGIALDDETAVRDFLERIPVSYPILIDSPGLRDTSVQLGNPKGVLPYTVLVSADGRMIKQKIGPFRHGEIDGWANNR